MMITKNIKYFSIISTCATIILNLTAAFTMDDPWTWNTKINTSPRTPGNQDLITSTPSIVGIQSIRFFQKYISPADGPRCNFYPSCSRYAKISLNEHGVLIGTILSFERFMRDHGWNQTHYPLIWVNNQPLYLDPVDANVYWWDTPKEKPKSSRQK